MAAMPENFMDVTIGFYEKLDYLMKKTHIPPRTQAYILAQWPDELTALFYEMGGPK